MSLFACTPSPYVNFCHKFWIPPTSYPSDVIFEWPLTGFRFVLNMTGMKTESFQKLETLNDEVQLYC